MQDLAEEETEKNPPKSKTMRHKTVWFNESFQHESSQKEKNENELSFASSPRPENS